MKIKKMSEKYQQMKMNSNTDQKKNIKISVAILYPSEKQRFNISCRDKCATNSFMNCHFWRK